MALTDKLSNIADAIRGKTGKTEEMTLDQMATEINGIETGGGGDHTVEDGLVTRRLTEYSNDRVTSIGARAFYYALNLQQVSFPNVVSMGNAAFQESSISSFYFPKLETVGTSAFRGCKLVEAVLPSYNGTMPTFRENPNLEKVDVGDSTDISASTFASCPKLSIVVLRRTASIVPLSNVSAFSSTPFASGGTGGTVYCPSALIEQYQQATNWSTLYAAGTCNFVALEGSEYE